MQRSPIKSALGGALWLSENTSIRLFGDPILTSPCSPINQEEISSGQAQKWADKLTNFLMIYREKFGIGRGLAANQIGISKQMLLVWLDSGPEVYINPKIIGASGKGIYPESCISAAGLIIGDVVRPWTLKLQYTTLAGTQKTIKPDEIHSRILLHEIDHISGKLCSDLYEPGSIRLARGITDEILKAKLKRLD